MANLIVQDWRYSHIEKLDELGLEHGKRFDGSLARTVEKLLRAGLQVMLVRHDDCTHVYVDTRLFKQM